MSCRRVATTAIIPDRWSRSERRMSAVCEDPHPRLDQRALVGEPQPAEPAPLLDAADHRPGVRQGLVLYDLGDRPADDRAHDGVGKPTVQADAAFRPVEPQKRTSAAELGLAPQVLMTPDHGKAGGRVAEGLNHEALPEVPLEPP